MKIQFERSGGFTGIPLNIRIDSETLAPEERKTIQEMIESARFFSLPEKILSGSPESDRFTYRITIEKQGASHTVEVSDSNMPEALQPLVQQLMYIGRRRR